MYNQNILNFKPMKTKTGLLLLAVVFLSLIYYFTPSASEKLPDRSQQASFNFIKCTVAKYRLSDVDTTQQISPLFETWETYTFPLPSKQKGRKLFLIKV